MIRTRLSSESLFMLERTTTVTGQSSNRVLQKLLFGPLDLGDTALVAAACEGCAQPGADNQGRLLERKYLAAQCQYVCVVMFAAVSRRQTIIAMRRANPWHLVRHDARPGSHAIDNDSPQCMTGLDSDG